jgi:hypothetical protein
VDRDAPLTGSQIFSPMTDALTMLEGVADLMNLSKSEDYLDQLHYEDARSNVAMFNGILKLDGVPGEIAEMAAERVRVPPHSSLNYQTPGEFSRAHEDHSRTAIVPSVAWT